MSTNVEKFFIELQKNRYLYVNVSYVKNILLIKRCVYIINTDNL